MQYVLRVWLRFGRLCFRPIHGTPSPAFGVGRFREGFWVIRLFENVDFA